MTWKIWRALQSPPKQHPLYKKSKWASYHNKGISFIWWIALGLLIVDLFVFPGTLAQTVIFVPVLVPLLVGTVYGVIWTIRLSTAVHFRYKQGLLNLLAVSPPGLLTACWAISTGNLYGNHSFQATSDTVKAILKVLIIIDLFILFAVLTFSQQNETFDIAILFGIVTTFIGMSYIDFIQSAILSILIGIVTGVYHSNITDTRIWATGIFLTIQAITYAIIGIFATIVVPPILALVNLPSIVIAIAIPIAIIPVFASIREIIIQFIWRYLDREYDADQILNRSARKRQGTRIDQNMEAVGSTT